jgi:hypothetical protein
VHISGWLTNASIEFGGLFGLNGSSVSIAFDVISVLADSLLGFSLGLGLEGKLHIYRPASKLVFRSTLIERELVGKLLVSQPVNHLDFEFEEQTRI